MMLNHKTALVFGGGGAIGGAAARAFAREGARVFLAGRTASKLDAVAGDIRAAGGAADTAVLDVFDADAVHALVDAVAAETGGIDIAMVAVGFVHVQGTPFLDLTLADFVHPVDAYLRALFVTTQAVARPMAKAGSGVILTLSTPGSRLTWPGFLGYGIACAAKESFSRRLAVELGPHNIRVVCLMPNAVPEAIARGSHAREVFAPLAAREGLTVEEMLAQPQDMPALRRFPTLEEVAEAAVFAASPRGGAITGAVMNLSCGLVTD
ncbi:MAG: SDR family oxidoreductase [Proteobacteria bacterium]|nr:SDR family oxidoreductase [Pseudomonadota bacterium]